MDEPEINQLGGDMWSATSSLLELGGPVVAVLMVISIIGFAIALYAIFILLSDLGSLHVGVFRTFGMNPLAAYVLHGMIGHSMHAFAPNNAPALYCWFITGIFIFITYVFVRHLEKHKIFVRL